MNKLPLFFYAVLSQVLPQVHAHEQLGQIVENRCGIFALCACAESVGRHTIDSELSSLMPNQGANASLFELDVAAQQIGLATIALHWRDQPSSFDISTSPAVIPVVNHAGKQHFLAVLASRGDQLYVMDFPTPAKWYLTSDIRKRWKWNGQALHIAVTQEAVAALRPQQLSWYEKLFFEIGRAVQQECRDRSRMPSSA
eukprot:TRINITY_DN641_c0_g1_i8.p1 TRINITY_DN641_c0_g1~~TRINITY_DN641_c0_g1_i8.p1  ORF type:complete len:198 (+),score=18.54 TRINITY_DN641_c0_g1_i8:474-1067(+)